MTAWDEVGAGLSKSDMDKRLKAAVSQRGWKAVVKMLYERRLRPEEVRTVEVGCGTGTMALTFALMGSRVTLIDNNALVLDRAGKMFGEYGCSPALVKSDCMLAPPSGMEGGFDLVISSGLAEHFTHDDRRRCIEYHYRLAADKGIVFITVPNRLNLPYWVKRAIRSLTGTWGIDVEVPFLAGELKGLARRIGFTKAYVIGYTDFFTDVSDNIRGVASAIADALPKGLVSVLRRFRSKFTANIPSANGGPAIAEYCRQMAVSASGPHDIGLGMSLIDMRVSELTLVAVK